MNKICTFFVLFFISFSYCNSQWQEISNGLVPIMVNSILILNDRMLVGTENGICERENTGKRWKLSNNGLDNGKILNLIFTDNKVFAATGSGLYFSTDSGENWIPANKGLEGNIALSFAAKGNNWYSGYSQKGIFKSADNGQSWTNISGNLKNLYVCDIILKDNIIFVGTYYGGMAKSTDGGASWQEINNGLSSKYIRRVKESEDKSLIVGTTSGIYRSTDDGNQWSSLSDALSNKIINDIKIYGDTIIAGTNNGVYISYDIGNTWNSISATSFGQDVRAVAIQGYTYFAGNWVFGNNEGNLYNSTDYGVNWNNCYTSQYLSNYISMVNVGKNILIGNIYSTIIKSTNKGEFWASAKYISNNLMRKLITVNDTLYAATEGDGILFSIDTGKTWNPMNDGLSELNIYDIAANDDYLFVLTSEAAYSKKNSDTQWKKLETLGSLVYSKYNRYLWGNKNSIIILGDYNFIKISKDKGKTWIISDSLKNIPNYIQTFCEYKNRVIIGTLFDGILQTSDLGKTWETMQFANSIPGIKYLYPYEDMIFAGTTDGVYVLTDNSNVWQPVNIGIEGKYVAAHSMFIDDGYIYIALELYGVYKAKLADFNFTEVKDNIGKSNFQIYPNPFIDNLNISYNIENDSKVEISIFDIYGNLIKSLVNEIQCFGAHSANWNGTNSADEKAAQGVYLFQIKINNQLSTSKVVHIK